MAENISSQPQAFADSKYTKEIIFIRERVYGRGWFFPGGETSVKQFLLKLNLRPGDRVLDIGCGAGGSAIYMAKSYRASVHGVDFCTTMIDVARDRLATEDKEVKDKVHFELADITKVDYDSNSYDVIFSLGAILYIAEKEDLFKNIYKWLKPGGTILIGDICAGDQEQYSTAFTECNQDNSKRFFLGFLLRTIKDYIQVIEDTGFKNLVATDDTNAMIQTIEKSLMHFQSREDFVKEYSQEAINTVVKDTAALRDFCRAKEHLFVVFQAKK